MLFANNSAVKLRVLLLLNLRISCFLPMKIMNHVHYPKIENKIEALYLKY